MVYFESKHVLVYWEEECKCVHSEWHGFVTTEDLKNGMLKGLELAKAMRATKWLSDQRDMHVYDVQDQAWVVKEFVPAIRDAGISKVAFVKPLLPATRLSLSRMRRACDPTGEQSGVFETMEDAYAWLACD